MKVLIVCPASFKTGQTGDAAQGRETVKALSEQGHEVKVVLVRYVPLRFEGEDGTQLDAGALKDLVDSVDVIHLLPVNPTLCAYFKRLPHKPTLGSSIFWGGWERVIIAWKMALTFKAKVHDALRALKPLLGFRMNYRGVDVFLPNSQAEGDCVMRYWKVSPHARYIAVPNGFVAPTEERLASLKRPMTVPGGDYVVVPGVFARRKNQLSLIRALKDMQYPVVFIGGEHSKAPEFLEQCKAESNERMRFLGFVPSTTDEYWAILKYARCACLVSDCETPGIAMIEAAYAGCRPVITKYGGTQEYFGFDGEYLDPCSLASIRDAVRRGWLRGRLRPEESRSYRRFTWKYCVETSIEGYYLAQDLHLSNVSLLSPYELGSYQFFRQWVAGAWAKTKGEVCQDLNLPWKIKMCLEKVGAVFSFPRWLKNGKQLIVLCGGRPGYFAWPWCYRYEIVPIMWDCWPKYWPHLPRFIRRNHIRTIFCTSSQTAEYVRKSCPGVNAVWLPEGIDVKSYPMGCPLTDRPVDVLEMGRKMKPVHDCLLGLAQMRPIRHVFQAGKELLFPDFASLTQGLRDAKMVVCYPRCDTHSEMAGDVETLTQRYWECMLSGALIVGRAPRELIDFCGYNPVITLGDNPGEKIREILDNISDYQELADRNRAFAEEHAGWDGRMKIIKEALSV